MPTGMFISTTVYAKSIIEQVNITFNIKLQYLSYYENLLIFQYTPRKIV